MDDLGVRGLVKQGWVWRFGLAVGGLLLVGLLVPATVYYRGVGGSCGGCHEIAHSVTTWKASTHRNIACTACHAGSSSLDPEIHLNNFSNLIAHIVGGVTSSPQLNLSQVSSMVEACRKCHQKEYADWAAGPHGVSYRKIFLNTEHNQKEHLTEDCLRCHGMYFEESIGHLVSPLDGEGPWRIIAEVGEDTATIPCLACHRMHSKGDPVAVSHANGKIAEASRERSLPSLALFDRRDRISISTLYLPIPVIHEGDRQVKMSQDRRQGLCYQCHAPEWTRQVRSGDDRTCIGVHEGLSCLACHRSHNQSARASCVECHPRLSNCGIDVEAMDTTFRDLNSRHNIHTVKCGDCHPQGVPQRKDAPDSP